VKVDVDVEESPPLSVARAVTVYERPLVRFAAASCMFQAVVPAAVSVNDADCHAEPFQKNESLERWIVPVTDATPDVASLADPHAPTGLQPAVYLAVLYRAPLTGNVTVTIGATVSTLKAAFALVPVCPAASVCDACTV